MPNEHIPDDTEGGHGAYDPYESHDPEPHHDEAPVRPLFPWTRLFFAIGFAILAWLVFWLVIALAVLQFITTAVAAKPNEELRHISAATAQYLWEVLAYVVWAREERPFPFGPFPKV